MKKLLLAFWLVLLAPQSQALAPNQFKLLMSGTCDLQSLLGADLLGYWDATANQTIELSGSTVTAWTSLVNGYRATATGSPTYSATTYKGKPGIIFNGTTDYFTYAAQPFPSGSVPSEIAAIVANTGAGTRTFFSYGGLNVSTSRTLALISGVPMTRTGDGGAFIDTQVTGAIVGSGGLLWGTFNSTRTTAMFNNFQPVSSTVVPGTTTNRVRLGANTSTTQFQQGTTNLVIVTRLLSEEKRSTAFNCLMVRAR